MVRKYSDRRQQYEDSPRRIFHTRQAWEQQLKPPHPLRRHNDGELIDELPGFHEQRDMLAAEENGDYGPLQPECRAMAERALDVVLWSVFGAVVITGLWVAYWWVKA